MGTNSNLIPFSDSLYMALAGDSIEALVKPELRAAWEAEKGLWFPRTDTAVNRAYDRRTPGCYLQCKLHVHLHYIVLDCQFTLS